MINKVLRKIKSYLRKKNIKRIMNDGERWDPDLSKWQDPNHLERYYFAQKYISKDDEVLDMACGTGYGTEILSYSAKKIYGVDISKQAIKYANRKRSKKNIKFFKRDFFSHTIYSDIVVSFETIEHLDTKYSLKEIINTLEKYCKKRIIASVPYNEKEGNNIHHKHFNITENNFIDTGYFEKMSFFYQDVNGKIHNQIIDNESEIQNLIFIIDL